MFFWTPPHFWSLSLLMKDEYARAGVPMLPVVRGERETRRQILLYTVLLYAVSQLPFCAGAFGVPYLVASVGLGAVFIYGAWRLTRNADRRTALRLYLYSLAYLAALFAAMALDANGCRARRKTRIVVLDQWARSPTGQDCWIKGRVGGRCPPRPPQHSRRGQPNPRSHARTERCSIRQSTERCLVSSRSSGSSPISRPCSARITCITALIRARWVNACGKFPRWRPERASISSAYSPSGLA